MEITYKLNIRKYRWAVSAFFFIAGLTFTTWASRIPDIKNKLQLNEAGLGFVLLALPVGQMLSLPISAGLISKFGSRALIVVSALIYPSILILLALAANTFQLIACLFLFGLFANMLNIAMNTQAVGVEQLYSRSIMASFHGVWSLAGFTGAFIGTMFVSAGFSPLQHFIVVTIICLLIGTVFFKNTLDNDGGNDTKQPLFKRPDKNILLLGIIAFCCMICEGAMADWSGVYFQKVVKSPVEWVTLGYTAFMATMTIGRFLGDGLVVKFGIKKLLQLSGILIASGLLISILIPGLLISTFGFLLVGFGVSSVIPVVYGLAGKTKTMSASAALATVSSISFLGFLLGPPVIGFIAEISSLQWSFLLIALLGLGTTVLSGRIKTN
jgi:MFS family permease